MAAAKDFLLGVWSESAKLIACRKKVLLLLTPARQTSSHFTSRGSPAGKGHSNEKGGRRRMKTEPDVAQAKGQKDE